MPVADLLRVTAEPLEEARLVRAAGEVDMSTVASLRSGLDAARAEADTVLLDMSEVTFIDSTGLHVLLDASREAAVGEGAFFVVRPSAAVQRLIELSRPAEPLPILDASEGRVPR